MLYPVEPCWSALLAPSHPASDHDSAFRIPTLEALEVSGLVIRYPRHGYL
ncbi:unnamed protein product [Penicillium camemberti]|uniref:Str. FM013 n=1 Tax=Penicillium camemberti (strain FM 013) TaxID=1429867 RepID=A0A0G4NZY0_PENC3|nr:unnamed protein product [Penicillium camemberti]